MSLAEKQNTENGFDANYFATQLSNWLREETPIELAEILEEHPSLRDDALRTEVLAILETEGLAEVETKNGKQYLLRFRFQGPNDGFPWQWPNSIPDDEYFSWPEPVEIENLGGMSIPSKLLPEPFAAFSQAVAQSLETCTSVTTLGILAVVSIAAAKRFVLRVKPDWEVLPQIYVMGVQPPGSRKSAVLKEIMRPVREWENAERARLGPEIKRAQSVQRSMQENVDARRKFLIKKGNATLEEMTALANIEAAIPEVPPLPALLLNDVTPESLIIAVEQQGGRMAIVDAEGGVLETLSGLYSNNRSNINILLKGNDGELVRLKRKDREFEIEPHLTFFLLLQPEMLKRFGSNDVFFGSGLFERFLFIVPHNRLESQTGNGPSIPDSVRAAYHARILSLLNLPLAVTPEGYCSPTVLELEASAAEVWRAFDRTMRRSMLVGGRLNHLQGWAAKATGSMLRVAMLMHIAEHGDAVPIIRKPTVENAVKLFNLLIDHTCAATQTLGIDEGTDNARTIFEWIKSQREPVFSLSEVHSALKGHKFVGKDKKLAEALSKLIQFGIVTSEVVATAGRPRQDFKVNPRSIEFRLP